ncbi:conserved hypothetical protein [Streptomyces clavuligerus]|uniref:Putative Tra3-like protein n=1 Tax=Streptomyces clavuligerus TaxID=1901 RepID=Q6TMQ9_STRCL|nr:putative Tra3-like protein [Streptomyces clavuligerus]EDY48721.1 conserved hypothetical protein [Streptomyces clavuligerus]
MPYATDGAHGRTRQALVAAPEAARKNAAAPRKPKRRTTTVVRRYRPARRTPPNGYCRAIEAHRHAARTSRVDPAVAEAVERQTKATRTLSRRAFPEPDAVADEEPAPIDQARVQRRRQAAATEAAALRRARAEGAGLVVRETVPRSRLGTAQRAAGPPS